MQDKDKSTFNGALDTLANMLHVTGLEEWQKDKYFNALKKFSPQRFFAGMQALEENYKPRSKNDFPVIASVLEACDQYRVTEQPDTWDCRCCGEPFPAGHLTSLNCDCYASTYCYECGQCGKHCPCEKMTSLAESEVWKACLNAVKGHQELDKSKFSSIPEMPNVAWNRAVSQYGSRGYKIWRRGEPEPPDHSIRLP